MKKSLLLLLALTACGSAMAQTKELGLSNFQLEYPQNPLYEGDTLRFKVTVTNNGDTSASGYVGYFCWGKTTNWNGDLVDRTNSISLGWSESLAPGESREVSTYMDAVFGCEGTPIAYLNADADASNDTLRSDVYLTVVRAHANELVLSDLAVAVGEETSMFNAGDEISISANLTNQGREAQSGNAHLVIDGAEAGTFAYSLAPEEAVQPTFTYVATSGNHTVSIKVDDDENLTNNELSQTVIVFTPGRLNESFENLEYNSATYSYSAPEGWVANSFMFSSYGAPHGSMYASCYSKEGYLITPKLNVSANDSLSFLCKVGNVATTFCVYASTDFENWTLVKEVEFTQEETAYGAGYKLATVYFNESENATFANAKAYFKFAPGGTAPYPSVQLDCIQAPARIEITDDLAVLSVSAASYFEVGQEGQLSVVICNLGKAAASNNVTLTIDGEQLAVIPTGEVAVGDTVTLTCPYAPAVANPAAACQATLDADDADGNNAATASLVVYPAGGLTLPFTQYFTDYNNISEVPYWTFGTGWTLWTLYGNDQIDGRNKCITYQRAVEESNLAVSPLLNLENENLTISFWLRRDDNSWHLDKTDGIGAYVNATPSLEGATQLAFVHRSYTQDPAVEAAGWYQYTFTLAEGEHPAKGFIVLEGVGAEGSYGYFDFDALQVTGQNAKDWTVQAIAPAEGAVLAGHNAATYPVVATLANAGSESISGATVDWSVDGVAQAPVTVDATVAAGETTEVALGEYAFATAAEHVITVTVSNAEDKVMSNNVLEATIAVDEAEMIPYTCEFESEEALAGWTILDEDANGATWTLTEGAMTNCSYDANTGDGYDQNDWLISPALYIPAEDAKLAYSAIEAEDGKDTYEVLVAETLRDVTAFAPIYTKTIAASEDVELPLADYAGKTIYVAFRHTSVADDTEAVSLSIDNVNVTGSPVGIYQLGQNSEDAQQIRDLMGRTVKSADKGIFIIGGQKVIK